MNAREFEAAVGELGYVRGPGGWTYALGPSTLDRAVDSLVAAHGPDVYDECLASMKDALPNVVDALASLA